MKPILLLFAVILFFINSLRAQSCVGGNTLSVTLSVCAGIDPQAPASCAISPNPAKNVIYIVFNNADYYQLVFTDVTGKALLTEDNISGHFTINTSTLSNGLYFVHLQNQKMEKFVEKIEIQK